MKLQDLIRRLNETVSWAIGDKAEYAQNGYGSKHDQANPEYTLVRASIQDMFRLTHRELRLDVNDPRGGKNRIGDRVQRAHAHWDQGGHMNPPVVGLQIYYGRPEVTFGNGRHRLVAAFQRGERYAPVLVATEELNAFRQFVRVEQD